MNVTIIGTGYVGLTTAVTFAYLGHLVTCLDINKGKIEKLRSGQSPFYEPGLEYIMKISGQRLTYTSNYAEATLCADIIFIAVGTPPNEDGSPNLTYINEAFESIMTNLKSNDKKVVIVNKSTVPIGTTQKLQERLILSNLGSRAVMASNPEFLRQGRAVHDTLYPDRIVIGGDNFSIKILKQLYQPIIEQSFVAPKGIQRPKGLNQVQLIAVDRFSAELGKYAANAFLAMKISFINEMSSVCDKVGADINNVAKIIGTDPRIGEKFLQAGIGYGGSCFPKDTRALHYIAESNGYSFKLMSAVIEVNNRQKFVIISKLKEALGKLKGQKIAVLGLTFKPDTDDLREAPSIPIIYALINEGAEVSAHDPVALEKAILQLPSKVYFSDSIKDIVRDADAIVLLTEWEQYKIIDWLNIGSFMRKKILIDGRNALNGDNLENIGYEYYGIGRHNAKRKMPMYEENISELM